MDDNFEPNKGPEYLSEVDTREAGPPPRPRSGLRYVLLFGLFMLAGLVFLAWIGRPPRNQAIGEAIQRVELKPLVYSEQELSRDDLRGQFTVLHFWGIWCGYCKMEFPEFVELAKEFQDHPDVRIVSVSSSSGAEYDLDKLQRETQAFLEEYGTRVPTYSDPAALTRGQLAMLMPAGSFGYPTTILVDRDGKIAQVIDGYRQGALADLAADIHARVD